MLLTMFPGLQSWADAEFLGLSGLGWFPFTLLWVIQVIIVSYGMEMIRRYEAIAGPIILVTFLALAVWMLIRVDFSIAWSPDDALSGWEMWAHIFGGGALWVSIYGTFVLNFSDFTRAAKKRGSIVVGNFWGIPVNMLVFGLVVMNFRSAGIISAVIGFVILPWNLYDSPVVIVCFLGGLGALLAPLFGVVMVDYWVVRRTKVNVPQLYTEAGDGEYFYHRGFNWRAIGAFIPASAISLVFALVPAFSGISEFSWFSGAAIAALIYFVIARRDFTFREVDGEEIAVPTHH